jgi:hypothetical protein
MKKIIASAVGLMLAGGVAATTASAVESQFGGYWRTRAFIQDNFDGTDSDTYDQIGNRTRLYYTAKFSDDFKFVNKFEFDSKWGDNGYGDIGTDGVVFEVKHSYADFNLGPVNTKIGAMWGQVGRGFVFDDDFSGIWVTGNFGNVSVPVFYIRAEDEDNNTSGQDRDIFGAMAAISVSDAIKVTPYFAQMSVSGEETDSWYLGADVDLKMDAISAWGTFIYNGGTYKDLDNKGFLVAGGVDAGIVHGQAFFATGDDNDADGDNDAFTTTVGGSYYWSEIMGYGTFDNVVSNGSPANKISNIVAVNAGVTVKPVDKLSLSGDVWYAQLVEDDDNGETELGWEFDAKATYALMDNLNLDVIFAYLVAGDATGDEDPLEAGVRLSLSF